MQIACRGDGAGLEFSPGKFLVGRESRMWTAEHFEKHMSDLLVLQLLLHWVKFVTNAVAGILLSLTFKNGRRAGLFMMSFNVWVCFIV